MLYASPRGKTLCRRDQRWFTGCCLTERRAAIDPSNRIGAIALKSTNVYFFTIHFEKKDKYRILSIRVERVKWPTVHRLFKKTRVSNKKSARFGRIGFSARYSKTDFVGSLWNSNSPFGFYAVVAHLTALNDNSTPTRLWLSSDRDLLKIRLIF